MWSQPENFFLFTVCLKRPGLYDAAATGSSNEAFSLTAFIFNLSCCTFGGPILLYESLEQVCLICSTTKLRYGYYSFVLKSFLSSSSTLYVWIRVFVIYLSLKGVKRKHSCATCHQVTLVMMIWCLVLYKRAVCLPCCSCISTREVMNMWWVAFGI